jgi:3-hydroxybutyryl-CoA dehydrogenase
MEKGLNSCRRIIHTLEAEAIISEARGVEVSGRITGSTDLKHATSQADLITESIVEDLTLKQEMFARVEGLCPAHAILTSNTSGLPATQLASSLKKPERFAVTHYWNPPHLMPLVDVVKGEKTAQTTIDPLVALLRQAGKKPVVVLKDTPGQLGNRLFHALIREAIYIVQQGIASVEDVDTAIKNGFGRRTPVYGTLEHLDVVGLDMAYAIQSYMGKALCNETEPAAFFRDLVQSHNLGASSGKGFYDWSQRDVNEVIERRDRFLIEVLKSEK